VAVEVVAVALQGPHPPFVNRAIVSKRSSHRAATVAKGNRGQAGSRPACAAIARRARALRAASRSTSLVAPAAGMRGGRRSDG
jgi:hypothetical protein